MSANNQVSAHDRGGPLGGNQGADWGGPPASVRGGPGDPSGAEQDGRPAPNESGLIARARARPFAGAIGACGLRPPVR